MIGKNCTAPRAVVLAAGIGGRFGARTSALPKPLLPIGGVPLICHTLAGLARAGSPAAVVVTGYRSHAIERALTGHTPPATTFVHNPDFRRGASFSLRAARDIVGEEPFLLAMSDHLLSSELLCCLVAAAADSPFAAVVAADSSTAWPADYVAEATKLRRDADGRVTAIGKQLQAWDALDCGAFYCTPATWQYVDQAPLDCDLSTIFRLAADDGAFGSADVTGASWYDVDTAEDLVAAERLLERA